MAECRNYFYLRDLSGGIVAEKKTFAIEGGVIRPVTGTYLVGQYIRIIGSVFNDSVLRIEKVGDGYIDISVHDEDYPPWVQPTGLVDSYNIGDRVTHANARYVSRINANVFVPGTDERWWEKVDAVEHSTRDEEFTGIIAPLAIPGAFLELGREISAFHDAGLKKPSMGQLQSESFGSYSYSMATGPDGLPATWKSVFASRLHPYRKSREEVV